ncbi:9848_t:CDS:2 [Rhizophagus irregularis]|nr:9848_t:CDS:2 [Rhizophagus irregularis]
MSIEQYFKTKMPKEDVEFDNNESSEVDSDLEEADIEVPNNYRRATQKKLNLKKKKVQLLSKRKTGVFQNEWLNIYKWLIYDGSRNLMFCSLCQSHKKQNKFRKEGSKDFKSSALSEHFTTKDHTDATNREIAKVELIKVTNNAIDRAQNHVSVLMKIIFWLAENDISLNKLPEVVRLCRILDCPQLLSASNTITYENNVSGREILSAISNSIEEIIWKELAEAAAFGIMVDESTDISCLTNKLMSFASDGASVMLGRSTGVASRLKEINECLFITHCIAHRLALACNSAEKKVDFCKHAEHVISKIFQRKNIQISDIDPIIELTLNKIQQQFLDYDDDGKLSLGEHLNKFLSHFSEEENNYSISAHQLLWNENYEADLIADILSFASAVVLEIQERFPDRPLLNSMKILDHANWPSNKEELTNYGEEKLNMLSEFYKKEINNICGEWFGYKAIIHSNFRNIKIEKLLPRLFEFYYDTFPNIIKLLGIIYSIPFSSVDCERGFSKQNLIKTDLRNSLNNETLHYWMMVGLEETDLSEFDFTRALQIWNSAYKRRI